MENKYYTPEIEEFHIGFEYEELEYPNDMLSIIQKEGNWERHNRFWKKRLFSERTFGVQIRLDQEEFRTKYLDKDDIESFGFEVTIVEQNFITFTKCRSHFNIITEIILCLNDPGRIILKSNAGMFMDITIKNKSELKRLLKQLNIL